MRITRRTSGTIAGVLPSMPPDDGRESRAVGARPGPGGATRDPGGRSDTPTPGDYGEGVYGTAASGVYGASPANESGHTTGGHTSAHSMVGREQAAREDPDPPEPEEPVAPVEVVPVRRQLSLVIAGFAGLLGIALILGAQTSGPDARTPYAIVVFGVQALFVLAWTMAVRPPALRTVAVASLVAGAVADVIAVLSGADSVVPLVLVAVGGVVVAALGQLVRGADRARFKESLGGTMLTVLGVVAFASLVVLTRHPTGTQTIAVCLVATGIALVVARLTDAVFARPRVAAQVPRGATGIIGGAMLGTLAAAGIGIVMVPFSPARGAVLGVVAAGTAGLVDLAVDYAAAVRTPSGAPPALWVARHMQGPLGAFAAAAAVAYVLSWALFS